jgi:enoyl-CoA hydratase
VPEGGARLKAEMLAHELAVLPQSCMQADRISVRKQHGLCTKDALRQEWLGSKKEVTRGIKGAMRFGDGKGRGGQKDDE